MQSLACGSQVCLGEGALSQLFGVETSCGYLTWPAVTQVRAVLEVICLGLVRTVEELEVRFARRSKSVSCSGAELPRDCSGSCSAVAKSGWVLSCEWTVLKALKL